MSKELKFDSLLNDGKPTDFADEKSGLCRNLFRVCVSPQDSFAPPTLPSLFCFPNKRPHSLRLTKKKLCQASGNPLRLQLFGCSLVLIAVAWPNAIHGEWRYSVMPVGVLP